MAGRRQRLNQVFEQHLGGSSSPLRGRKGIQLLDRTHKKAEELKSALPIFMTFIVGRVFIYLAALLILIWAFRMNAVAAVTTAVILGVVIVVSKQLEKRFELQFRREEAGFDEERAAWRKERETLLSQAEAEKAAIRKELSQAKQRNGRLRDENNSLEGRLAAANRIIAECSTRHNAMDQRERKLEQRDVAARAALAEAQEAAATAAAAMEQAKVAAQVVPSLQAQAEERDRLIAKLRADLAALAQKHASELHELKGQLKAANRRNEDMRALERGAIDQAASSQDLLAQAHSEAEAYGAAAETARQGALAFYRGAVSLLGLPDDLRDDAKIELINAKVAAVFAEFARLVETAKTEKANAQRAAKEAQEAAQALVEQALGEADRLIISAVRKLNAAFGEPDKGLARDADPAEARRQLTPAADKLVDRSAADQALKRRCLRAISRLASAFRAALPEMSGSIPEAVTPEDIERIADQLEQGAASLYRMKEGGVIVELGSALESGEPERLIAVLAKGGWNVSTGDWAETADVGPFLKGIFVNPDSGSTLAEMICKLQQQGDKESLRKADALVTLSAEIANTYEAAWWLRQMPKPLQQAVLAKPWVDLSLHRTILGQALTGKGEVDEIVDGPHYAALCDLMPGYTMAFVHTVLWAARMAFGDGSRDKLERNRKLRIKAVLSGTILSDAVHAIEGLVKSGVPGIATPPPGALLSVLGDNPAFEQARRKVALGWMRLCELDALMQELRSADAKPGEAPLDPAVVMALAGWEQTTPEIDLYFWLLLQRFIEPAKSRHYQNPAPYQPALAWLLRDLFVRIRPNLKVPEALSKRLFAELKELDRALRTLHTTISATSSSFIPFAAGARVREKQVTCD